MEARAMRIPRVRITVRRLMVAVAMLAFALGYGLHWLRRADKYHMNVRIFAQAMWPGNATGQPVPISIGYDFRLDHEGDAPPGMPLFVEARIKVVDTATGIVVDRCDFDRLLVAGIRGNTSDSFVWLARNPGPGRYRIERWTRAWQPVGGKKSFSGGNQIYRVSTDPSRPN
jgi:hypothetical protein